MSLEIWLSNLWFYSLQTGILILVGGLLAWIFRLREPGGISTSTGVSCWRGA